MVLFATGDEGFIQGGSPSGAGVHHFRDLAFQITQVLDEGETFANEAARLEGGLSEAAFGKAGFDALPEAAFSPRWRLAGFAAATCEGPVR